MKNQNAFIRELIISLNLFANAVLFQSNTLTLYMNVMIAIFIASLGFSIVRTNVIRSFLTNKVIVFFLVWFLLFWVFVELHYSIFPQYKVFSHLGWIRILMAVIVFVSVTSDLSVNDTFNVLAKSFTIVSVPLLLFLIVFSGGWEILTDQRFGDSEIGLNPNEIALHLLISFFFTYNLSLSDKKWKLYAAIVSVVCSVFILLTGCKRALICMTFLFVFIYRYYNRGKTIKTSFFILTFFLVTYYLVFSVPVFYDIIGSRFEMFLYDIGIEVGSSQDYDSSTELRKQFVPIGLKMFGEKPLFGHGFAYFETHSGLNTIVNTFHTHNNYLEILINYGVLGFILYYRIFLKSIIGLLKIKNKSPLVKATLTFLVLQLVFIEPTTVSYYSYIIFYMFLYFSFRLSKTYQYGERFI